MMPFYRTAMGVVHMRGTKLPPPCGAVLLVAGQRQRCLAFAPNLCDGPGEGRKTCDRPLCEAHSNRIGPNRHLCPACHLKHRDADPQRGLFTSLV